MLILGSGSGPDPGLTRVFAKVRGGVVSGFRVFGAPGAPTAPGHQAEMNVLIFLRGDLGGNFANRRAERGDKFYLVTRCAAPAAHTNN